jgi:hypothetical protein
VSTFLGIAREREYSPGKVEADRAILDAVAARLRAAGHEVTLVAADDEWPSDPPPVVFAMCQGPRALAALWRWENAGVRAINTSQAILQCHRRRTLTAFAAHGIHHPASALVPTAGATLPPWADAGAWVKRADVHAMEAGDVVRAGDVATVRAALGALAARGIASAIVQQHVDGPVLKFYAVRGHYFAARSETLEPVAEGAALRTLAEAGAAALGLEIYGGDVVRDATGAFRLIDLNDWPSFAPVRPDAAEAIAAYLTAAAACQRPPNPLESEP